MDSEWLSTFSGFSSPRTDRVRWADFDSDLVVRLIMRPQHSSGAAAVGGVDIIVVRHLPTRSELFLAGCKHSSRMYSQLVSYERVAQET